MTNLADDLNRNIHKEQAETYKSAVEQMIKAFIKKCPKEILIEVLKSEKIISRVWSAKHNKYAEYKKE
jgi:hypothetical protein